MKLRKVPTLFSRIPEELRKKIAEEYIPSKITYTELARKYSLPASTIRKCVLVHCPEKLGRRKCAITDAQVDEIVEKTLQGSTQAELAEEYRVGYSTIRNLLVERLGRDDYREAVKRKDRPTTALLKELIESGERDRDVLAEKTGYSTSTVYKHARDLGVELLRSIRCAVCSTSVYVDSTNKMYCSYACESLASTDDLLDSGKCEACGDIVDKLCVDHDHATGNVRGALCDNCNKALGLLKDSPDRIRQLLEYLER